MKKQNTKKVEKNMKATKKQEKGSLYLFSQGLAVIKRWVLPPVSLILLLAFVVLSHPAIANICHNAGCNYRLFLAIIRLYKL